MRCLLFICLLLSTLQCHALDRLQVEGYLLPNGLQVLLKPGYERGHVAIRLVVGVGQDDFSCSKQQLAHLLEHMLFSGIDAQGESGLEERIQALGGEWNAYTGHADTTFAIEAPTASQGRTLELLLSLLTRTELTEQALNTAQQIIRHEQGGHYSRLQHWLEHPQQLNSASHQLAEELGLRCSEPGPVESLTLAQVEQVRKTWYAPNNMTLIVVGDLDPFLPAFLKRTYGQLDPVTPTEHRPLPQIHISAAPQRSLIQGWVGNQIKVHWIFPEPVLDDQPDEIWDLLADYLEWALYRQLRLEHRLSYGPWKAREVLGGVGFLSLNTDLERDDLTKAEQVFNDLKAQLIKEGVDPAIFARLQHAAISRQAWAVQGNSALADYYWSALSDYAQGRFADPVRRLRSISVEQANQALRQLLAQPAYIRIEKPLLSSTALGAWGVAGIIAILACAYGLYHREKRKRPLTHRTSNRA